MENSKIQEKIDSYRKQRDELVKRANEQVIAFNAAIEALEDLLKDEFPVESDTTDLKKA